MTEVEQPPVFTEPAVVPFLYLNGVSVERGPYVYRLVGWTLMPDFDGEARDRRIVVRLGLPLDVTRKLMDDLREGFRRGGSR